MANTRSVRRSLRQKADNNKLNEDETSEIEAMQTKSFYGGKASTLPPLRKRNLSQTMPETPKKSASKKFKKSANVGKSKLGGNKIKQENKSQTEAKKSDSKQPLREIVPGKTQKSPTKRNISNVTPRKSPTKSPSKTPRKSAKKFFRYRDSPDKAKTGMAVKGRGFKLTFQATRKNQTAKESKSKTIGKNSSAKENSPLLLKKRTVNISKELFMCNSSTPAAKKEHDSSSTPYKVNPIRNTSSVNLNTQGGTPRDKLDTEENSEPTYDDWFTPSSLESYKCRSNVASESPKVTSSSSSILRSDKSDCSSVSERRRSPRKIPSLQDTSDDDDDDSNSRILLLDVGSATPLSPKRSSSVISSPSLNVQENLKHSSLPKKVLQTPTQLSRLQLKGKKTKQKSPGRSLRLKTDNDGKEQMMLDFGQKLIETKHCPGCGMAYTPGEPLDEATHRKFHRNILSTLKFPGWKNENVIQMFPDGSRIIVVMPDQTQGKQKVAAVKKVMNDDLGFVDSLIVKQNSKTYFYVSEDKRIVGCCIAQQIFEAFRVIDNHVEKDSSPNKVLTTGNNAVFCCNTVPEPAKCGINRIWVLGSERRKGIASLLLDAVRNSFLMGYPLKKKDIAFTDPTVDGRTFAARYTGTREFLVYRVTS